MAGNTERTVGKGRPLGLAGLNLVRTIAAPVLVYLFFRVLTLSLGIQGYGTGADLRIMLMNMVYSGLIALAMSYNLTSGRFDFSVGAVMIFSSILGCTLTVQWGLSPALMLGLLVAIGLVLGLVSGVIYTTLKLPPMVVSLGVAMIYEAFSFLLNGGNGVKILTRPNLMIFNRLPYNLILLGVVLVLLVYLLNFTKFGYNAKSLQSGQKNAVEVGVNERRNAIACYALAGALMGCAGSVYMSQYGMMAPKMGLGSSSVFVSAFLPLFIGGALAKYSDRNIGIIMGAFIQACISSGMIKLGFSTSLQTVVNGLIVLVFLVYVSNAYKFVLARLYKAKRMRALAEREAPVHDVG
jgi:ribose transport system permease protein